MNEKEIDKLVSEIVKLSLQRCTKDPVRDIFNVMMDLSLKICELMKTIREQEAHGTLSI